MNAATEPMSLEEAAEQRVKALREKTCAELRGYPETPFQWPPQLRNWYTQGLKCTFDGVKVSEMSREQLVCFIGFLDEQASKKGSE